MATSRRTREKIALVLAGLVAGVGLAELVTRAAFPPQLERLFIADPILGLRLAPNQRVRWTDPNREFTVVFTTNSYGDPDVERSVAKPAGVYRIAVIGDSMAEGAEVFREERFGSLLEDELNRWIRGHPGAITRVEVLNFAVASYATKEEWQYYHFHVRRFMPDLVLLVFYPFNDVQENSFFLQAIAEPGFVPVTPFFRLSPAGEPVPDGREFYSHARQRLSRSFREAGLRGPYRWLRDRSSLLNLLTLLRLRRSSPVYLHGLDIFRPDEQQRATWREAWVLTEGLLARLAQDIAADGAGFHVAVASSGVEVSEDARRIFQARWGTVSARGRAPEYDWTLPNRQTEAMLARLGLPYTNLLPAASKAAQGGRLTNFLRDGHYTAVGHRVVARQLLPVLQWYLGQRLSRGSAVP